MLTLRQIEVIRAIMVTGTVGGAARLLNVSSPGISRVMKHAEASVGVKLFGRRGGRYSPTREANAIFNQINGVYDKVEDLQFIISRIKRGADIELKVGSVPSIANVMVPRAIADVRQAFPNLLIEIDILKIEDVVDFLMLGKGELVVASSTIDHPMLTCTPLARGRLKCIVPETHPLARRSQVNASEIVKYPLIGVDPNDPYGRIMASSLCQPRFALRSHDPRPLWLDRLRLGHPWSRHRHHRRVHARRRPLGENPRARYRRADGVPDLRGAPQGCHSLKLRHDLRQRPARPHGGDRRTGTNAAAAHHGQPRASRRK